MPDNSFAERFKRLDTADLLGIINKPEDYQPDAVEAARKELASRQLNDQQLNEARAVYDARVETAQAKDEKWNATKDKAASIAKELSPVQFGPQPEDKYIRNITIFSVVYFLFSLYRSFWFFQSYFDYGGFDWSIIDFVLPIIWLCVAGILFGLRRRWGWILLTALFLKIALGSVFYLTNYAFSGDVVSGLIPGIIFWVAFYAITRMSVRKVFKADKAAFTIVIVIGVLAAMYPFVMFFFAY